MPIFHLHMFTSHGLVPDHEGAAFPDLAAARKESVRDALSLLSAEVLSGELNLGQQIQIHSETGQHLATVQFDEVVRITPAGSDQTGAPGRFL